MRACTPGLPIEAKRSRISPAARWVKLTARIFVAGTNPWSMRYLMRWVMVRVLPVPARREYIPAPLGLWLQRADPGLAQRDNPPSLIVMPPFVRASLLLGWLIKCRSSWLSGIGRLLHSAGCYSGLLLLWASGSQPLLVIAVDAANIEQPVARLH